MESSGRGFFPVKEFFKCFLTSLLNTQWKKKMNSPWVILERGRINVNDSFVAHDFNGSDHFLSLTGKALLYLSGLLHNLLSSSNVHKSWENIHNYVFLPDLQSRDCGRCHPPLSIGKKLSSQNTRHGPQCPTGRHCREFQGCTCTKILELLYR